MDHVIKANTSHWPAGREAFLSGYWFEVIHHHQKADGQPLLVVVFLPRVALTVRSVTRADSGACQE